MHRRQRMIPLALLGLALSGLAGCQGGPSSRRTTVSEPTLGSADDKSGFATSPAPRTVTAVDRHPLLYKPREMYETSGNNKVVKVAAATIVGVPMGIVGEFRQIFVGTPRNLQ